jgi:hypothetical protein
MSPGAPKFRSYAPTSIPDCPIWGFCCPERYLRAGRSIVSTPWGPRPKHSSISNSSAINVRLNRDHTPRAVRVFADERIRLSRVLKTVDDHVVALARGCGGERPSDSSRCTRHQHHHAFAALVILTARYVADVTVCVRLQ